MELIGRKYDHEGPADGTFRTKRLAHIAVSASIGSRDHGLATHDLHRLSRA
jgi:hypothetical protein